MSVVVAGLAASTQLIVGQAPQGATRVATVPGGSDVQAGVRNVAEEQFVRRLANEFSRTLAVVAANPDENFSPGSFAGRVRSAYMRLEPAKRTALRPDALKLVPLTGPARPTATLRISAGDTSAARAEGTALSPALRAELRALIRQRLLDARPLLDKLARSITVAPLRLPKTWVEGGVFDEAEAGGKQEITLNQPQVLGFHWRTEETGTATGYWELRQPATGLLRERVLATGTTNDDPSKAGVQGFFEIDFAKHLPPKPPARGAWTYHVRVKPLPESRAIAEKARPDRSLGHLKEAPKTAAVGSPREPEGTGPWSAPVIIHYGAPTTPPTTFHDVYRRVHFHFDSITLIEDQHGPGDEEFHIIGFVQSNAPSGAGNQYRLGGFVKLDRVGQEHTFGDSLTFQLPSAGDFPRAYTVVLSILEEDDGGMLEGWQTAMATAARDALSDEVDAAFREELRKLREQIAQDASEEAMRAAIDVIRVATTSDFYAAWLKTIVTIIANAIEAQRPDDFYGTEVVTFVMPTNRVDVVRNSFAFVVSHQLSPLEWLTGQVQANGNLLIRPEIVRFRGLPSYPEAGSFDGVVDIKMHWTFAGRGL